MRDIAALTKRINELEQAIKDANKWVHHYTNINLLYCYRTSSLHKNDLPSYEIIKALVIK